MPGEREKAEVRPIYSNGDRVPVELAVRLLRRDHSNEEAPRVRSTFQPPHLLEISSLYESRLTAMRCT